MSEFEKESHGSASADKELVDQNPDGVASIREKEDLGMVRPAVFKSTFQEVMCVLLMTLAIGASNIAIGISFLSLDDVATEFGVEGSSMAWCSGSIALGNGVFLLIMGGVADALGRMKSVFVSFFLFALMNLISGFMQNFVGLCVCRALIGVVCASATPASAGILGALYRPGQRKNRVMAAFAAGSPVGFVVGIVIGGIATQALSWRSGHFFLAIVYLILTIMVWFFVPKDEKLDWARARAILKKLDYTGSLISIIGFTLFCFALTQADAAPKKWNTPYIIALTIVGGIFIIALFFYEEYVPANPIMPMELWHSRNFTLAIIIMFLCWMNFQGSVCYYAVLYFEDIKNYTPLLTTACMITMGVAGVFVNIFAAFTLHLIPGSWLMMLACAGFTASGIIWAVMPIDRIYWGGPFISFILTVLGADLAYNVANMVTLKSVPRRLQSSASAVLNTAVQLAAIVGLSISGSLVGARYDLYGEPEQNDYPDRLFDGFKNGYWFAVGCGAAAMVLSIFLKVGTFGHAGDQDHAEDEAEREAELRRSQEEPSIASV